MLGCLGNNDSLNTNWESKEIKQANGECDRDFIEIPFDRQIKMESLRGIGFSAHVLCCEGLTNRYLLPLNTYLQSNAIALK